MSDLNEQQKDRFSAMNARLGLAPMQSTIAGNVNLKAVTAKQHIVLSSNPAESDIPPYIIAVGSIAELNKLIGSPDDADDSHVQYPAAAPMHLAAKADTAQSKAELIGSMDDNALDNIKKAATAYLTGDSNKVSDYEAIINATLFPGKVAVFSDPNGLEVPADGTYTISGPDPIVLNYGFITIGENGEIIIQTDVKITTQIITQL